MTQNIMIFNPDAPVNDNYEQSNRFIGDAYNAILDLLYNMEQAAKASPTQKRDVVNAIADIVYRCDKFLEDI